MNQKNVTVCVNKISACQAFLKFKDFEVYLCAVQVKSKKTHQNKTSATSCATTNAHHIRSRAFPLEQPLRASMYNLHFYQDNELLTKSRKQIGRANVSFVPHLWACLKMPWKVKNIFIYILQVWEYLPTALNGGLFQMYVTSRKYALEEEEIKYCGVCRTETQGVRKPVRV